MKVRICPLVVCKNTKSLTVTQTGLGTTTWYEGESHTVDAIFPLSFPLGSFLFSVPLSLREGNVHLELNRLLEDGGATRGLILGSEAGLGDDAVTQRRDLNRCNATTQHWKQEVETALHGLQDFPSIVYVFMFYGGGWCIFVSWLCRPFTESRRRYSVKEKELERERV